MSKASEKAREFARVALAKLGEHADRTGDKKFDRKDVEKIIKDSAALADQGVHKYPVAAVCLAVAVTAVTVGPASIYYTKHFGCKVEASK